MRQGILAFYPKTKCRVREEPKDYLDKLDFHSTGKFPHNSFYINCTDDWLPEEEIPPYQNDNRCFGIQDDYLTGTTNCTGNPYNEDFFYFDGYSFPRRYQTLFNLYSFDSVRSAMTTPPELVLTDCDFKYFAGGHDSLIQVETNNFGIMNWAWRETGGFTVEETGEGIMVY